MFKIPKNNVIESDEGFSVEVLGRTGVKYTEGKKKMKLDSEILAGPSGLVLYTDSIKAWEKPYQDKEVDKGRIINNIKRAFKFSGFDIEIM